MLSFHQWFKTLRPLKGGHKHLWEVYKTWASASLLPSNCCPPIPPSNSKDPYIKSVFRIWSMTDWLWLPIHPMVHVRSNKWPSWVSNPGPCPQSFTPNFPYRYVNEAFLGPPAQPSPATSGMHTAWSQKSRLAKPARAPDPQHHETRITVLSC